MTTRVNNKECNCKGLCDRWSCTASKNDYFTVESRKKNKEYTLKFSRGGKQLTAASKAWR